MKVLILAGYETTSSEFISLPGGTVLAEISVPVSLTVSPKFFYHMFVY